jgi:murein DD-endopeptidase MepM/ murein hydrolase activator NlpD
VRWGKAISGLLEAYCTVHSEWVDIRAKILRDTAEFKAGMDGKVQEAERQLLAEQAAHADVRVINKKLEKENAQLTRERNAEKEKADRYFHHRDKYRKSAIGLQDEAKALRAEVKQLKSKSGSIQLSDDKTNNDGITPAARAARQANAGWNNGPYQGPYTPYGQHAHQGQPAQNQGWPQQAAPTPRSLSDAFRMANSPPPANAHPFHPVRPTGTPGLFNIQGTGPPNPFNSAGLGQPNQGQQSHYNLHPEHDAKWPTPDKFDSDDKKYLQFKMGIETKFERS